MKKGSEPPGLRMAVTARLLMLTIVSTAAIVAIAWLTLFAFNPAVQGRKSCALCRVKGDCAKQQGANAEGACCCPQADANGCFTGAFACPPGFTCWADGSLTGTCHDSTNKDKSFADWQGCRAPDNERDCSALDSNDCCCVMGKGGPTATNSTICATPTAPPLNCMHVSSAVTQLDAVPMGVCQVKQPSR